MVHSQAFWDNSKNRGAQKQILKIQSNLCTTAALGTQKNWAYFKGVHYSQVVPRKLLSILENGDQGHPCKQVAVVQ
jgi:hypothetical protein